MKILHTADWHLGDNFHGFDRVAEHEHFLRWLTDLISNEKPDALLVSGDIYDNANPSAQAEELLYSFLVSATMANPGMRIIITSGNHDSGRRLQAPSGLMRPLGAEVRGLVEKTDKGEADIDNLIIPVSAIGNPEEKALVLAVPYLRSGDYEQKDTMSNSIRSFFTSVAKRARKLYGKDLPIILMAHLYAAGAEVALNEHSERLVVGGEDCIDVDQLNVEAEYVALGHIHKAQQVGADDNMVFYAGSPVPMSFTEKDYTHGVNKIVLGASGGMIVEQVEYTPLRALQSIPKKGDAPLADILEQIKALPKASKVDPDCWPYVEIRLKDADANPAAQNEIMNALSERAARLCRLIRVVPEGKGKDKKRKMNSLDQLRNISPLDIALDAYLQATGNEMGDEEINRFKKCLE